MNTISSRYHTFDDLFSDGGDQERKRLLRGVWQKGLEEYQNAPSKARSSKEWGTLDKPGHACFKLWLEGWQPNYFKNLWEEGRFPDASLAPGLMMNPSVWVSGFRNLCKQHPQVLNQIVTAHPWFMEVVLRSFQHGKGLLARSRGIRAIFDEEFEEANAARWPGGWELPTDKNVLTNLQELPWMSGREWHPFESLMFCKEDITPTFQAFVRAGGFESLSAWRLVEKRWLEGRALGADETKAERSVDKVFSDWHLLFTRAPLFRVLVCNPTEGEEIVEAFLKANPEVGWSSPGQTLNYNKDALSFSGPLFRHFPTSDGKDVDAWIDFWKERRPGCLEERNVHGQTPLMFSVIKRQWAAAACLIAKGADKQAHDRYGQQAFHLFAEEFRASTSEPSRYGYTEMSLEPSVWQDKKERLVQDVPALMSLGFDPEAKVIKMKTGKSKDGQPKEHYPWEHQPSQRKSKHACKPGETWMEAVERKVDQARSKQYFVDESLIPTLRETMLSIAWSLPSSASEPVDKEELDDAAPSRRTRRF